MSDKITDIENFIRDTTINNCILGKEAHTRHAVARYVYDAHVKPLEDALAKADKAELVEALEDADEALLHCDSMFSIIHYRGDTSVAESSMRVAIAARKRVDAALNRVKETNSA